MVSKDDIYAKMTVAGAVFFAIFEIGYLFTTTPPFDMPGYVIGRDFVETWIGAKSALLWTRSIEAIDMIRTSETIY